MRRSAAASRRRGVERCAPGQRRQDAAAARTASAVAAKATTMPVMTIACGTGSPPSPIAAPRARDRPEDEEDAGAEDV